MTTPSLSAALRLLLGRLRSPTGLNASRSIGGEREAYALLALSSLPDAALETVGIGVDGTQTLRLQLSAPSSAPISAPVGPLGGLDAPAAFLLTLPNARAATELRETYATQRERDSDERHQQAKAAALRVKRLAAAGRSTSG